MNDREKARHDAFGRMATFGKEHASEIADGSEAQKHFTKLAQIRTQLDTARAKQKPQSATAQSVLVDALRLDIQNITRTARAIALEQLGFADRYRGPATDTERDILTAADAILVNLVAAQDDPPDVAAQKQADVATFIAHELPATFVTDLQNDRKTIATADDEHESSRETGVGSTSAIGRLIDAGMTERAFLDAIMHNKYSRDADTLRAWLSAAHIERPPKSAEQKAKAATKKAAKKTTGDPAKEIRL